MNIFIYLNKLTLFIYEIVDIKLANECVNNYKSTMKGLGIDTPSKGFSKSVAFNKKELLDWMQNLGKDTHEIKSYFAVYSSFPSNSVVKKTENCRQVHNYSVTF